MHKWARSQSENFCTDAFVHLINHLIVTEPDAGLGFVRWLCLEPDDPFRFEQTSLSIATQRRESEGTPDIRIETNSFLALIEVKK